jgi:Cys-rich repeat protein
MRSKGALRLRTSLLALAGLAIACDGESVAPIELPNVDAGLTRPLYGSITVTLREATEVTSAYSLISGTLYNGPKPNPEPLEIVAEGDGCRLRRALHPFCAESCGSAAVCVDTDTCLPYPEPQNVGNIRIDGLDRVDGERVTMEPYVPNFFYQSDKLPYPPCSEGASLQLEATAFTAMAPCVAPLRVASSTPVAVRRDQPVTLHWQQAETEQLAKIGILLDISHHGGKRGDVLCEVDDTGSHSISASLVNALIDLGLAGFPSVTLTRFVRQPSSLTSVDFVVQSSVTRPVDTGVQSCLQDADCPNGETCDRTAVICR